MTNDSNTLLQREKGRDQEAFLRLLLDSAAFGFYCVDREGATTLCNEAFLRMLGFKRQQDVLGKKLHAVIHHTHPDGSPYPREECPIYRAASSGQSTQVTEELFFRVDGTSFPVQYSADPIMREGELQGAVCNFIDITERKLAEDAIRHAGERFRFMAETMPQKIFSAKPNGDVDYFNRQWTEFTGLTFEQIRDWGWTQFIHPDDLEENVSLWKHSIETGEPFHFEHRFRRADGEYRWHLSRAVAMRDAGNNILMWIGSNTDVHEQKKATQALLKVEKLAAAGRMAASVAHEINNPLSAVVNTLYLMGNQDLAPGTRQLLDLAVTELARVVHITKQTLDFYRFADKPVSVDLCHVIDEMVKLFRPEAQSRGIHIQGRYEGSCFVHAYPGEIRQVFTNLLTNALEARGNTVWVRAHASRDWANPKRSGIRISVADNGKGVPQEQRQAIFEPFFTTKGEKGTGLGLWVVRGIMLKHDGWIRVRSSTRPGRSGTCVSLFLPATFVRTRPAVSVA